MLGVQFDAIKKGHCIAWLQAPQMSAVDRSICQTQATKLLSCIEQALGLQYIPSCLHQLPRNIVLAEPAMHWHRLAMLTEHGCPVNCAPAMGMLVVNVSITIPYWHAAIRLPMVDCTAG